MAQLLKRTALFALFFLMFPSIAALLAATVYRNGGLRDSSGVSLALLAWRTDSGFVASQLVQIVLSMGCIVLILGSASLLAWRDEQRYSALRVGRFVALVWLLSIVLFPGTAAWIPVFRQIPWTLDVLLILVAVGVAYAWRQARAGYKEWCFAVVALTLFYYSPRPFSRPLDHIAQRPFTPRDIIVIAFDSINFDETYTVLRQFSPSHGRKIVFTNAMTSIPLTSGAWRTILTGYYPPPMVTVVPSLRWGSDRDGWLPSELRKVGYDPTIDQDVAGTNWFGSEESLRVIGNQGWKQVFQLFAWKAGFPFSTVGASWWVGTLGAPTAYLGRFSYCTECFIAESLANMAKAAAKGPVFWANHTCLAHEPYQLSLTEALRVPGWWQLSPRFFLASGSYASDARAREARMGTVKSTLRNTLNLLDRGGVLGRATVFVLSDHGPRGEGVPRPKTNNIMLAMFSPLDGGDSTVRVPVSLVDIAPTIRRVVGLPDATTDGRILPRTDDEGDARRAVRTATFKPLGVVYESIGIRRSLSAAEIAKLAQLRQDGSFDYSPQFMDRVRRLR